MIVFGGEGRNLTPPPDPGRRACWELAGRWGKYLGTPIAPWWFVTADHVQGQVGDTLEIFGQRFAAVARETIPGTDTALWRVERPFPRWATLCTGDELGREAFFVGRGTARGAELPGKGWHWGPIDKKQSWGSNRFERVLKSQLYGELLIATFDKDQGPDECVLSTGDSGGPVFVKSKKGDWRLAGFNHDMNSAPDGQDRFYSTAGKKDDLFRAALYDSRGLFLGTPERLERVSGERPAPTTLAVQRLSAYREPLARLLARPASAYPAHPPFFQTRLGRYGTGAALVVGIAGATFWGFHKRYGSSLVATRRTG